MYIHTTYCVPGLGLGTRDTAINKTDTVPFTLEEWVRGTTRVSPPADGPVPLSQPSPPFPLDLDGKFQV